MNAPDRFERFVVPEDEKKIKFEKDTRVENAGTFTVQREDHTIGNLVRMELLRDPNVTFAGYKIPHPLEYRLIFKVQTRDKRQEPRTVMEAAMMRLVDELEDIKHKFEAEESRMILEQ